MGRLRVICEAGDIVVSWNPADEASTKKAREEFDRLQRDGYEFFKSGAKRKTRVKAFDEKAGEILAAPGVMKAADKKQGTRQKAMAGQPNTRIVARL